MSQESVNLVVRAFTAAMAGDWESAAPFVSTEVELHGTIGGFEEGQTYRGLAEVMAEFQQDDREAWAERTLEPEQVLDAGDKVVVLLHEKRTGRDSGVPVESHTGVVFEIRDGLIVRIQGFMDPAAALEAAGLSE
jgi:ketosteroid isomerase-like protein